MFEQTASHNTPEPMLRIGATMGVPAALRSLGLEPNEILLEGGFDPGLFDDPDNVISFSARGRLMAHCTARAKCEHFGLLVGQHSGLHSLGLVGLLMKYSPDVETALNNLVRNFHLHARGAALSLQVQGNSAILSYQIPYRRTQGNNHVSDGAVAVMFNILRELCGREWKALEFWSTHKVPENIQPFRQFFRARLRFNAELNALVFNASWLSNALPEAHSDVHRLVQKQIDSLAAQHGDDFPEQVRTVLRTALLSGHSRSDQVALLFSMHPRTLNRRLNSYGIGYQELVDETRFDMAQQMLKESNLEVGEIALMLHYAEARSFIRAFRRWSDTTPARWRATQKQLRRGF